MGIFEKDLPPQVTENIPQLPSCFFPLKFLGVTCHNTNDLIIAGLSNNLSREKTRELIGEIGSNPMKFGMGGSQMPSPPPMSQNVASSGAPPTCLFTVCFVSAVPGFGNPEKMLKMRLRIGDTGDGHISGNILRNIHQFITHEKVTSVCFKSNGEYVVLEDETNLYPSDKLVASFLLLLKG